MIDRGNGCHTQADYRGQQVRDEKREEIMLYVARPDKSSGASQNIHRRWQGPVHAMLFIHKSSSEWTGEWITKPVNCINVAFFSLWTVPCLDGSLNVNQMLVKQQILKAFSRQTHP